MTQIRSIALPLFAGFAVMSFVFPASAAARLPVSCAWSPVSVPQPATQVYLQSVDFGSEGHGWAVGSMRDPAAGDPFHSFALHWDGVAWTYVATAAVGPLSDQLRDVVDIAAGDAWAVGASSESGNTTLIERWNGTSWQRVPSPVSDVYLSAVSGAGSADVWAVGYRMTSVGQVPVTLHWNGSTWIEIAVAAPGEASSLDDVVAVGAKDVWAVGGYWLSGVSRTLVEHWDGRAWSVIPSPNVNGFTWSTLNGVTAGGRGAVWAVGAYGEGTASEPLAIRWNGKTWQISPMPLSPNSLLRKVYANRSGEVWAVGWQSPRPVWSDFRTLVFHWDGSAWSIQPTPNLTTSQNVLYDIGGYRRTIQAVGFGVGTGSPYDPVYPLVTSYLCR